MRFRLKKTIQLFIVIAGLVFYINFVFISRNTSFFFGAVDNKDQLHVKQEKEQKQAKEPNSLHDEALRFHVVEDPVPYSFQNESIYPSEKHQADDRIIQQLKFIPPSIKAHTGLEGDKVPLKVIHLASGLGGWEVKRGQATFLDQKCRVPHCSISDARSKMKNADVVLFDGMVGANGKKPPGQIWMLFMLESPYHTPILKKHNDKFNWTATYRHDSTIVAPYEKFVPFNNKNNNNDNNNNINSTGSSPQKNYAEGKTKMVAWFVSNCGARNTRMQYAQELGKHVEVDIYGRCGTKTCPRHQSGKCFDMLNKDYRFYLSFENSNCRDYITEKFFVNGLKHDVIPIVMGAAPEDYVRAAPPHSYIHVDDFKSPKELADYLNVLANNEKLYNEYFQWKGTGDIINTYFWCRVCALAHDAETRGSSWYGDVNSWWRGDNVCIGQKSWRDIGERPNIIAPLARWQPQPAKDLLQRKSVDDTESNNRGQR